VLAGCGGLTGLSSVTDSLDKINQTMQNAVDTLGEQSSAWQGTLKDLESKMASDANTLESKVASDVHDMINQVDGVIKDGVQFGQESINCQIDIFSNHARIALKNMLTTFLNKWNYKGINNRPLDPFLPIVCSVNPTSVNVAKWDPTVQLVLSGTDFNLFKTTAPDVELVHTNGSKVAVPPTLVNTLTNYRVAINVPVMITQNRFDPDTVELVVLWNGREVNPNKIPVVPPGPPPDPNVPVISVVTNVSPSSEHPSLRITAPSGTRLISGGCHSDWAGAGQLLTASYPDGNAWVCAAKDQIQPDVAALTGYAVVVSHADTLDIRVTSATGAAASHPTARVDVAAGYSLVGGGCFDHTAGAGNLLVDSYPVSGAWICNGKDHDQPGAASITAYAIGIRSTQVDVAMATGDGPKASHPHAVAALSASQGTLVGGGCNIPYGSGAGNMLWATYPNLGARSWVCDGKDHIESDPSIIHAFAFGLRIH
jgi:hypothetical protein